jgi:UDP-N-acetylenolpyruvoylglucosamine reductase
MMALRNKKQPITTLMAYPTTTHQSDIETLRAKLKGTILLPEDTKFSSASQPWNRSAVQRPAFVVMAASSKDIQLAVSFANENGLGVGVMSTGHGIGTRCNDGVLINTSLLRGVTINPDLKQATVEAGALWTDVISSAYEHGLATLAGSAPHVGVVGYTTGGGFGYLGRKYGLNSGSVVTAEMVTADGTLTKVSADKNEDLFWAVRGGGGNYGVITSLTFRLYPLKRVFGGAVFYPVDRGHEVLTAFAKWSKQIPDEITAGFSFMNVPSIPAAPEMLRGKSVVVIKGCYCGENPERGEQLFSPVRTLSKPLADTFATMPVDSMGTISNDPVDPMGNLPYGGLIRDLSPQAIEAFVKAAGAKSGSSLLLVEIRTLGAALAQETGDLRLMGNNDAQYSLNAVGIAVNAATTEKSKQDLSRLFEIVSPYLTGEVFLNLLEVDPTEQRVRACYTADDWQRLIRLKTKYDPKNIFRFNKNIPPQ